MKTSSVCHLCRDRVVVVTGGPRTGRRISCTDVALSRRGDNSMPSEDQRAISPAEAEYVMHQTALLIVSGETDGRSAGRVAVSSCHDRPRPGIPLAAFTGTMP
jgi:hypothetical protein